MSRFIEHDSVRGIPLLPVRRKALSYLDGRRLDTGGFCYFKSWGAGAPSVLDTHAALLSFSLLNSGEFQKGRSDEKTRTWIRERFLLELSFEDITGVWHLCSSLRLMGERFSEEDRFLIFEFLKKTMKHFHEQKEQGGKSGSSGSLSSLIAWNRLADISGWPDGRPFPSCSPKDFPGTLIENLYRWEMDFSGWYLDRFLSFVDLSPFESPLFGYVLAEGSTATDMAVIVSGVLLEVKQGGSVSFPEQILDWVICSQGVSGGFGRIPGAVPDLLSTAQALLILEILSGGRGGLEKLFPGGLWWSLQED